MRRLAALLLALLLPGCAAGEGMPMAAYGGSGEDILREVVSCSDGLFAVGSTASADYDLSMRTRTGETGWALRLDSNGEARFSFTSAHSGMLEMIAPAAFEDGSHTMVLTDETRQRGEWIVLDADGRQTARVVLPKVSSFCPDGAKILQLLPVWTDGGAALAALVRHEDGYICCARLVQDGAVSAGEAFAGGEGGRIAAGRGEGAVYAEAADGGLNLVRLVPGGLVQENLSAQADGCVLEAVGDVLLSEDESVTIGGARAGGGFLVRVSREGEQLFFLETDEPVSRLTATDTGFAALAGGTIVFTDEDGAVLGEASAPENTLDLAASLGGAAALSQLPQRGKRQAIFTHIDQPEMQTQEEALPIEAQPYAADIAAGEGHLLCSAQDAFGVQVTHVAADGSEIFSTRTPIHTAADALEWHCAAVLDDGSILLGGRCLTGEGGAKRQEGVAAVLGSGGVLRRMETVGSAGAVCAVEITPAGEILLHVSRSDLPSLEADGVVLFPRE